MSVFSYRTLKGRFVAGSLSRNGLFALGQSLVASVCLFLAYRLVISEVGLERFGVWSLLLASSAFARVGDVSGGGSLARFVATALKEDQDRVSEVIHTVVLSSLIFNGILGCIFWLAASYVLPMFIASSHLAEAYTLMPYVVASIVVGPVAIAVTSGIDGTQRADQRALITIASSVIFLVACALLVPRVGVLGFGAAQIAQQVTMLTLGWIVLRRHIFDLGWLPLRWRGEAFAETTGYAMKMNAIGLVALLFDPLAKFGFNHSGGPGLVALYDLASKLVLQMRGLAVSTATPLVPAFAARMNATDPIFQKMLERVTRIMAVAAVGTAVATLAGAPIMSIAVLGRISSDLLSMNAMLTAGWSINMLAVPIYFAAQGFGVLRWNFLSQVAIALSVPVGVFIAEPVVGPFGVICSIVLGLILSTIVVLLGNAHAFGVTDAMKRLLRETLGASVAIGVACSIAFIIVAALGGN